jgi:hypothetical protein
VFGVPNRFVVVRMRSAATVIWAAVSQMYTPSVPAESAGFTTAGYTPPASAQTTADFGSLLPNCRAHRTPTRRSAWAISYLFRLARDNAFRSKDAKRLAEPVGEQDRGTPPVGCPGRHRPSRRPGPPVPTAGSYR